MTSRTWVVGLTAVVLAVGAHAQSLPFTSVQHESTVIALTSDGPPGMDIQSGPLGSDGLALSTSSIGATDLATAGVVLAQDLLTTSADVSASAIGSAVASTRFVGSFVNGTAVSLSLDFSAFDFSSGSGSASTTLFVSLTSDGQTLFADFVTGPWHIAYNPVAGSTSVLDLTLASEVSAAFLGAEPGNASGLGMVSFVGTVPEASSWMMLGLGLALLTPMARHRRRRDARRDGSRSPSTAPPGVSPQVAS